MPDVTFLPDEFLVVTNTDEQPIEFGWNNRRFVVHPGRVVQVPAGAVINKGGDPRAGVEAVTIKHPNYSEPISIPSRLEERTRLKALYGKHEQGTEFEIPPPFPQFTVSDIEGTRLYTVLEDPDGTHVGDVSHTPADESAREDRIRRIESELRALREEQATSLDEVPQDDMGTPIAPVLPPQPAEEQEPTFVRATPTTTPAPPVPPGMAPVTFPPSAATVAQTDEHGNPVGWQ